MYCQTPFPNYAKLKAILRCIESTALGFPSCGGNNAISMNSVFETLPAPTPLPTQPSHTLSYLQPSFSVCAPSSPLPSHPFPLLSRCYHRLAGPSQILMLHPMFPLCIFLCHRLTLWEFSKPVNLFRYGLMVASQIIFPRRQH